jgi:DNA-directed RNA polymerase subunit RPC12/RpoP
MYVLDSAGTRVPCRHPMEFRTIEKVTGLSQEEAEKRGLTGFMLDHLCLDCGERFELDWQRDGKQCPHCRSSEIRTMRDAIGATCPKCHEGTLEETIVGVS